MLQPTAAVWTRLLFRLQQLCLPRQLWWQRPPCGLPSDRFNDCRWRFVGTGRFQVFPAVTPVAQSAVAASLSCVRTASAVASGSAASDFRFLVYGRPVRCAFQGRALSML